MAGKGQRITAEQTCLVVEVDDGDKKKPKKRDSILRTASTFIWEKNFGPGDVDA